MENSVVVDVEDEVEVQEVDVEKTVVDADADAADEDVDVDVEVEVDNVDLDVDARVAVLELEVYVEVAVLDVYVEVAVLDVYVEVAVLEVYVEVAVLDVDVELEVVDADVDVSVAVDERVQDDDAKAEMDTTVAIVDRKLVVQRWLVALQDVDVELWVVEPNDDKMRKDSDMMQVDVAHCCQVEKEVAILEVEEEVCIAQLSVDEEEGSDAVEAADAAPLPLVEACCHHICADDFPR